MKIPDRLRQVLIEAHALALRAPVLAAHAPNLPDRWRLCWCSDCSASLVMEDGVSYAVLSELGLLMHADGCPWAWLATA